MRKILMVVLLLAGCSGTADCADPMPTPSADGGGIPQVDAGSMEELCNLDVCRPSEIDDCRETYALIHSRDWTLNCPSYVADLLWCSRMQAEEAGECPLVSHGTTGYCAEELRHFYQCAMSVAERTDGGV